MRSEKPFKDYLKRKQFASSTVQVAERVIRNYFEWLDKENLEAGQATYNDLLVYMKDSGRKGAKKRTVQYYINILKHYYDHLIEEGEIETNPAEEINIKGVKRKTLYHILEPHELHQLYNSYQEESPVGKRNKAMLGLLVYQGLKTEELAKLEVTDIKLREGKIEVPGGKKSNHRTIQLESHQIMDLYEYILQGRQDILKESGEETNKLIITPTGKASTISNLTRSFLKPLKAQNKTLLNAKQIRASVITKWLKIYNLRETQYLAGHRYIGTTEGYQQNDMEGLKEEINQFHPL
tara:strand:- start:367 stop:1248 length:882 start_codon:yes stop_codon:yes gene_type:complete